MPEVTVKYPADALPTDHLKAELLYCVAVAVARTLNVDLNEVDVDLMPYDHANVQRNTLVSIGIVGLNNEERMEDITEFLTEIGDHVRRAIHDTFQCIAEHKKLLFVWYTPVRQDCWVCW